jgi:hypothetical protein
VDARRLLRALFASGAVLAFASDSPGVTLEVGPGRPFARIEDANAQARPGDVILVYPRDKGEPYEKTGVLVRQGNLTFRAATSDDASWVRVSGEGFDHSGRGSVPRAVFQFDPGADGCVLEGFEIFGAHNASHNGAGVRINQASHVTVRRCNIHHNDMGIMSGGDGTSQTAVDQRIEACRIHHNGDFAHPGYNHNLYLGGTSVTLRFCEVHASLTGHNVKSRAHHTRVEYSYVHHSANREFDLVDARDTARPGSHAVLLGNVIVKDPACKGNRAVIHFGQDGGREHDGTAHLAFNTIVTPFVAPVIELSAPKASARLVGNLVTDGGFRQNNQQVAGARAGATTQSVAGAHNWFSGGFAGAAGTRLDPRTNVFRRIDALLFVAPRDHDYRLAPSAGAMLRADLPATALELPPTPGRPAADAESPLAWQYRHPAAGEKRPADKRPALGAHAP